MNEKIQNLDLEPIMVKIMDKEEGLGWELDFTKQVAEEYRKYLYLCLKYEDEAIVPSKTVDEFWHFHILDTLKYQEDCQNIFGYFLHHFPYFGMRGEEDKNNLNNAWETTLKLYEETFNEKPNSIIWLTNVRCPKCGRRVKNTKFTMDKRPSLKEYAS